MDPVTSVAVVVKETEDVIDEIIPEPEAADSDGMDKNGDDMDKTGDDMDKTGDDMDKTDDDSDDMPEKEPTEEEKFSSESGDSPAGQYIYYTSKGALIKVNKEDPTDKISISRAGGRNYVYDPKTKTLYFLRFNAVVKETLGVDKKPVVLVDGIPASGNMIVDRMGRYIYVTDVITGKIISYNIETMMKKDIFTGLTSPNNLTPSEKFSKILWTEGSGSRSILYSGPVSGGDKTEVTRVLDGSEDSYLYIGPADILYLVKQRKLVKVNLNTNEQTVVDSDVTTVSAGPKGTVIYAKNNGDVMQADLKTDETVKITTLADPVDAFSAKVVVPGKDIVPTAVYYTIGDTLKKFVPGDDGSVEVKKGRSNYVVDTKNNKLYSVFFDSSVMSENLDDGKDMRFAVTGLSKINDLKMDKKNGVLYFADRLGNEIWSYNVKTAVKKTIYSSLKEPKEIALMASKG